ncbi:MAG: hypothetical protein IT288_10690 [Bdellovibrionales bacterium]|nr:hypothetical protein [Bdellovibrionales bacterium]
MSKKLTKEDIKGPDAFIATSDKLGRWIEKHKVTVFGTLSAALLIGAGLVGWEQWTLYRERSAQNALYAIEAKVKKKQDEIAKAEQEKVAKKEARADRVLATDYGPLVDEYQAKIGELAGSKAAAISAIHLAALYMDYQEFEKAHALLTQQLGNTRQGSTFYGLLHMQLGTALAALNKHEDAKREFNLVVGDSTAQFLHAEAVLKLGLTEEMLGNVDQAREHYNRASQEFSTTDAGKTAKAYLRLLSMEKSSASR